MAPHASAWGAFFVFANGWSCPGTRSEAAPLPAILGKRLSSSTILEPDPRRRAHRWRSWSSPQGRGWPCVGRAGFDPKASFGGRTVGSRNRGNTCFAPPHTSAGAHSACRPKTLRPRRRSPAPGARI